MQRASFTQYCHQYLEESLALLREMVAINSYTGNAAGVNRLGELTANAFAPLGFEATFVPTSYPGFGNHLVLRSPTRPNAPTLALVSHLDTVYTEEEEIRNNFHWRREGTRIYGPGTDDIKGGTTLMHLTLGALRAEAANIFDSVNWVLLLSACEEVISADFRDLCQAQLPKDTLACLVFEGDGGSGDKFSMVRARKGRATFTIDVEGRGAHAGSSHKRGANAVVQLAEIVSDLHKLTSYEENLTVNVGSINGGGPVNRVPHFARAELEMRAFSPQAYESAKQYILAKAGDGSVRSADSSAHPCRIIITPGDETQPWPRNEATDRLVGIWQEAARDIGLEIATEERGGLSDGNVLWDLFPTVDGLGPRGDNCHCSERSADGSKEQEWVDVTSFIPKAVMNATAITKLVQGSQAMSS